MKKNIIEAYKEIKESSSYGILGKGSRITFKVNRPHLSVEQGRVLAQNIDKITGKVLAYEVITFDPKRKYTITPGQILEVGSAVDYVDDMGVAR